MTSRLTITLPDDLQGFVEEAVKQGSFESASAYVTSLVRKAKAKMELEAKLVEAMNSSVVGEFDRDYFEDLKARLKETYGKR